MSDQPVLINLPDQLYERIQQVAEASERSIEAVLLESLDILFANDVPDTTEPGELSSYADEQLWAIVERRLPWPQSIRLHELSEKSALSDDERQELEQLLDLTDRLMLARSEALRILKARGHNIDRFFTPISS
jgi:hypothetical protein